MTVWAAITNLNQQWIALVGTQCTNKAVLEAQTVCYKVCETLKQVQTHLKQQNLKFQILHYCTF